MRPYLQEFGRGPGNGSRQNKHVRVFTDYRGRSPLDARGHQGGGVGRPTLPCRWVCAMLEVGSTNRQIANFPGLSEGTVNIHLHRFYRAIGVSNRTQLTARSLAIKKATPPI